MSIDKTIQGLQHCFNAKCEGCPYGDTESGHYACKKHEMLGDALELLKARQWISVKDRLPDSRKWVLCRCRAEIYEVLRLNINNGPSWYHDDGHEYLLGFVTHWMPLPEPMKENV